MKTIMLSLVKVLACGAAFFAGTMAGGMLSSGLGLPAPDMPEGTDPALLAMYLLLASMGIGALVAYLAPRLSGRRMGRWLALAAFGWVTYSFTTYIEARIYTTFSSASLYKVVMDLAAFGLSSGAAVWLTHPAASQAKGLPARSWQGWAWRLALAWTAFPVIYLCFGKLVEPFVIEVYRQGLLEMTAPGWGQIIPAQALRSLLFLLVSLGLAARWNRSRVSFFWSFAAGLFLLVGGFYMVQAYWFPIGFRLAHSLEILAGSLVYAAALAALFVPPAGETSGANMAILLKQL